MDPSTKCSFVISDPEFFGSDLKAMLKGYYYTAHKICASHAFSETVRHYDLLHLQFCWTRFKTNSRRFQRIFPFPFDFFLPFILHKNHLWKGGLTVLSPFLFFTNLQEFEKMAIVFVILMMETLRNVTKVCVWHFLYGIVGNFHRCRKLL